MKKLLLMIGLGASALMAGNIAQNANIDKVAKCDKVSQMTVLNFQSEDNATRASVAICQYEDGKINMLLLVNESGKSILNNM